jgi:hypothetical protein
VILTRRSLSGDSSVAVVGYHHYDYTDGDRARTDGSFVYADMD